MRRGFAVVSGSCLLMVFAACGGQDYIDFEEQTQPIVGGYAYSGLQAVGAFTYNGQTFCTGTLVTSRMIVTAAHCLDGVPTSAIRFAIGPDAGSPTYSLPISSVHTHPNFNANMKRDDIGYAKLSSDAPVTPLGSIYRIDSSWVGVDLLFVGYGNSNGYSKTGIGKKRAVSLEISEVGATNFSYQSPDKNTCTGDSGGPAFYISEGRHYLVGVTSYGDRYCSEFGVDTRVDVYLDWLRQGV